MNGNGNGSRPAPFLRDLPAGDRPRQRLLRKGGAALSDVELVAVLLRTGCRGASAVEVARDLLNETGGLAGLLSANGNLLQQRGVGDVKAATVLAAVELGCRLARQTLTEGDLLDRPSAVANYLMLRYPDQDQEVMGVLLLDVRNRLIAEGDVFRGTLSRTAVEPRAILKAALMKSASGIILFHTHPSGDPNPSAEDLCFTRRMAEAGQLVGVKLEDHVILGAAGRWVSLKRRGAW